MGSHVRWPPACEGVEVLQWLFYCGHIYYGPTYYGSAYYGSTRYGRLHVGVEVLGEVQWRLVVSVGLDQRQL